MSVNRPRKDCDILKISRPLQGDCTAQQLGC